MRQCERCNDYSPDDARYCTNCGKSFVVGQPLEGTMGRMGSVMIPKIPGSPPEVNRKRKYSTSIPGLGVFGLLRRDPQTGKWGCGPGCLISTILVAILATLGGFLVLHQPHLSVSNVVPGGSMQVRGSNFPPDTTVDITVDGSPVASHSTNVFASVGGIILWGRQIRPSDHTVTVKSDGTFDTTVSVPSSWTSGSHHTIQATTQNAQASTQASIDVETQSSEQTSVVPPTPTPVIRTLTSQQTQSQAVNATGQGTTPGTQATGTLSFRNPYSSASPRGAPVTYNAGTVFVEDTRRTPHVQMMIDATITVPAGGTSVTVPAHVVQIGTIGNIPIKGWQSTDVVPALPVDIINITPFVGGTDPQSYTTVKQSDIDTAANSLKASTRQSALADLNSQLRPNEHLVGDPQCTYNVTSDHPVGDQTTTVTVKVETTCTAKAST